MNTSNINTQKKETCQNNFHSNNGYSFPINTGVINFEYSSNSGSCSVFSGKTKIEQKTKNLYTINLDLLQIVCIVKDDKFIDKSLNGYYIEKSAVSNNPSFYHMYKLYRNDGLYIGNLYSNSTNAKYSYNEVVLKVNNGLLYTSGYTDTVYDSLNALDLTFKRISVIDIAVDSIDLYKLILKLNKYLRSATVQISNDNLKISPLDFDKSNHKFNGFNIGNNRSKKSAIVYNKSLELKEKKWKQYIRDFWYINGLDLSKDVYRFELSLNYSILKKYPIPHLGKLQDIKFITTIFYTEISRWFKLYSSVRKKNMENMKKESALKSGHQFTMFHWNRLPDRILLINKYEYVSDTTLVNCKRSISFTLKEIKNNPDKEMTYEIEVIKNYTNSYHLQIFTMNKIGEIFKDDNRLIDLQKQIIDSNFMV